MEVRKSSGASEEFDRRKLGNIIKKAFKAAKVDCTNETVKSIIDSIYVYDGILCSSIRTQLEDRLRLVDERVLQAYKEAKDKKEEVKHFVEGKKEFIERYKKSSNTANATIDDNSNVGTKNIAVLNAEIHKPDNIQVSRSMIMDKLNELFPEFKSKNYIKDLERHIIYKNDESSFAGAISPYTYSAKEVVNVKYNGQRLLIPFDALWEIVSEESVCVDESNKVYQKLPENLLVLDKDGNWTVVTHITKKERHRNLVRVKTSFGEDIVVTDNHPMIIDDSDINKTVEASKSLGEIQYKIGHKQLFENISDIDMSQCPITSEYTDEYCFNQNEHSNAWCNRFVKADWNLGYFVGFFIGDGNYTNSNNDIHFTQNNRETLLKINSLLHKSLGVAGRIYTKKELFNCYTLDISSDYLTWLLKDYFKIQDKALNKTLPFNIYDFTEDFAKGILCGIIDSDGTINGSQVQIRLASRSAILQCAEILRHFNFGVGNTVQNLPFSNNTSYHTNYTVWGINFSIFDSSISLGDSFKLKNVKTISGTPKYSFSGITKIVNVQTLAEDDSFVKDNDYIYDITTETRTFALNNLMVHNCVSITMYPFLTNGIKDIGGLSAAPKNLDSFCGMYCNLIFAVSSQYAGAVATSEFLLYFTYFCKKEWGEDFFKHPDTVISQNSVREKTIRTQIHQYWQQVIYTISQPASARGFQSAFINFSYFDKPFFDGMFGNFVFPDGTIPDWDSLCWIQKEFMMWFNEERLRTVLTFPVESCTLLFKDGKFEDEDMFNFVCEEYARGHSFFTYISDSVDSLSSCCRLKNKIQTKEFNFTNGNIGVQTGSKSVISFNLSRIIQDWYCQEYKIERGIKPTAEFDETKYASLKKYLSKITDRVYLYHVAYNELLWDMYDSGLLPVYKAGFIDLNKQYLTLGLNGLNQAAEYLGFTCNDNPKYSRFCQEIFGFFKEQNELHKVKDGPHKLTFNTEQVPAESLAIKNYNWDKEDGYWVPDDTNLYASYVYKPNDKSLSVQEKLRLMGKDYVGDWLDGGSAAHINLDSHLSAEQYKKLIKYAASVGCSYLTWNVPNCECDHCHYIAKQPFEVCPKCGSKEVSLYDRIIGYLTKIKNWSAGRQIEQKTRVYDNKIKDELKDD